MSPLVQTCAVIVTMALVVMAVAAVRALMQLERAVNELSRTAEEVRSAAARSKDAVHRVEETVAAFGTIVPPARRLMNRFEELGERAARLSENVIDEIEAPIRTASAVVRGMRIGTGMFVGRLAQRLAHRGAATNGGKHHE